MGVLLDQFLTAGVRFELLPPQQLRALGPLTEELRATIRKRKPAILAELADQPHWRWRIVFADGRAIEVRYIPEVERQEVEAHYPGTKVEPLADTDTWRPPTAAERAELVQLIALVYAGDTVADRAEALAAALADPDSALICYRALVTEHGTMADSASDGGSSAR